MELKGLRFDIFDRIGVVESVRAGRSASRRLHPKEFIESLNDADAILTSETGGLLNSGSDSVVQGQMLFVDQVA